MVHIKNAGPDKVLKKNVNGKFTFSLNRDIRRQFDHECFMNQVEMSGTVEKFMVSYINMSKKMRIAQAKLKDRP
jgi:hypothetical protein